MPPESTTPDSAEDDSEAVVRITESHMRRGTRTFDLDPGESITLTEGVHAVEVTAAPFDTDTETEEEDA